MASFVVDVDGRLAGGRYRYGPRTHQHPHTPCALCHSGYGDGAKARTSRRGAAILIPQASSRGTRQAEPGPPPLRRPPPPPLFVAQEPRHGIDGDPGEPLCCHPGSPPPLLLDDGTVLAWTVGALARWPLLALSAWQEEITLGQYMGPRDPSPSHPPQLQAFPLDLERQK